MQAVALLGSVGVAPPSSAAAPVAQEAPDAPPERAALSVPIELTGNKPFVPVRVNGSDVLWFILDTGAGEFCISKARAEALGLQLQGLRRTRTGAGEGATVEMATTPDVTFEVGGRRFHDPRTKVVSLDHVEPYEGRHLDGLLGAEFFRRYVLEIDYADLTLRLHDPEDFQYAGPGAAIPIRFLKHLAVVQGAVAVPGRPPIDAELVVDTGVRTTVVFTRPVAERHGLPGAVDGAFAATIGGGVGGESRGVVGRLQHLRLGPAVVPEPVAVFSSDRTGVLAGDGFTGIVGGQILRRCRVFFDYPHRRLILEPFADVPAPYEYDMSGMFLVARGPAFSRFVVMSVMDGSPADDAAIRRGDVVTSVDGRPAGAFTLEEVRRLLLEPGRSVVLEIQRGDETRRVAIRLRRIV